MSNTVLSFLVLIIGVPIVLGFRVLVTNRRIAFAIGMALTRWISAERWRAPGVTILIGLVALGAAQWAAKLHEPKLFLFFLFVLLMFLRGVTGFEYSYRAEAEHGPAGRGEGWWRRSRY